ncbi:zinc finger and BTB domain-containing protein 20-like isoform X3 [Penaeus indicus]|uniref:zinc finger and BTB domain-containing protein 20-like isoform X3 n=1 Tax=Penaeus indicus TaxID=29960 RepID=UPI00300DBD88
MTDGMLSLSWNNHSTTFCHMLSALRHKDRYTDATLACEGKFYPVHKLVLSTCSQYFEEMFDHTLGKHPIVLLQDVKCDELEALLSYMYIGVVSVAQKDLSRLIKVAELLQIKGLAVPDEVQGDKNTHSTSRNARRSPQSRESVDPTDDRASPHPKRKKQDDTSSPSPRELFENHSAHSPRLSSYSKDGEENLDFNTSEGRSRRELYLEPVRGSESEAEPLHHREPTASNSLPEEPNMLSGVKLREQSAAGNPSKDTSEEAIVIKEEVWEDPELSHNNSIDPSVTYSTASDSADPDSHDGVQEEHTGTSKEFSHPGVPAQVSQELPEVVVEALAGPSGMQEWLGSNDFAAGLASVENFSINGSPPLPEHPQALQMGALEARSEGGGRDIPQRCRMRALSSSAKQHKCPYCCYSTYRKTHLIDHICTHTGEKPHSCPHCPARFIQKGSLNTHIRIHTGERPYRCPVCSQCFTQKNNMRIHKRTHRV